MRVASSVFTNAPPLGSKITVRALASSCVIVLFTVTLRRFNSCISSIVPVIIPVSVSVAGIKLNAPAMCHEANIWGFGLVIAPITASIISIAVVSFETGRTFTAV
jgi:hypothetical protein